MKRLCGKNEPCFENGEDWGHLKGVMCKHLSEGEAPENKGFLCKKTKVFIEQGCVYTTHKEYMNMGKGVHYV